LSGIIPRFSAPVLAINCDFRAYEKTGEVVRKKKAIARRAGFL